MPEERRDPENPIMYVAGRAREASLRSSEPNVFSEFASKS